MKCLIIGARETVIAQLVQVHLSLPEEPQVVSLVATADLRLADFSLFILQVIEFDGECMSWLRGLRRQSSSPIIFLCAAGASEEIIVRIAGITRDPSPMVVKASDKIRTWAPRLYAAIDAVTTARV